MSEPFDDQEHLHEYQEHAAEELLARLGFDSFHDLLFHFLSYSEDEAAMQFISKCNDARISILFDCEAEQ